MTREQAMRLLEADARCTFERDDATPPGCDTCGRRSGEWFCDQCLLYLDGTAHCEVDSQDVTALHLAVTRVIEDEIVPADSATSVACERAAAAAISVVLAEAQRAVLAAMDASDDYYISGYVNGEIRALVEAALAALGERA